MEEKTNKNKGRWWLLLIPVVIIAVCIVLFLLPRKQAGDVVFVKYVRSGGIAGICEKTIVFSDNGNYYLYENGEVYEISSKSYFDLMSKTNDLHLDEIDGFYSSRVAYDAMGTSFYVGYADGTYVTGEEYFDQYPKGHDAHKLSDYMAEITDRKPCDYEMKLNDTFMQFTYNLLVGDIYHYYGVYENEGDYYLYSSCGQYWQEKKLTEAEYQHYLHQAMEIYEKSDKKQDGDKYTSRIDMVSEVWDTYRGWLGNNEEQINNICEQIEDELAK